MPKFVHFDAATGAILNWMDTDALSYAVMPPAAELLAVTDSQYEEHAAEAMMVQGGKLVPFVAAVVPAPEPIAPIPPKTVTMRQARLALLAAGKLQAVTDAIAALPSPQKEVAQIEWDYAATVDRSSPFCEQMAQALGLDPAALDSLFTQAATL